MLFEEKCKNCGKEFEVRFPYSEYVRWLEGVHVEEFLTEFPEEKELFLTSVCSECRSGDE